MKSGACHWERRSNLRQSGWPIASCRSVGWNARAILGLPIPAIRQFGPAASAVILGDGVSQNISFANVDAALTEPDTQIHLFGKPEINGSRRLGAAVARGEDLEHAKAKALRGANAVKIIYG